ncbi:Crp/Fnr family transcriptional regulator [Paenibacillus apiarius]|uniref:Crp/Fnr family transcriptional regulator n=1 Tax=Paenibacillus apiarius TaxID=46240 RepID=UPI00197FAA49|nr:Crp/Fnr family transcriptional regulator [Paenibacillus apiarius]MBN3522929.1 Crp/Fnr family transcriptional regulator [Paenibacillus apiarius]
MIDDLRDVFMFQDLTAAQCEAIIPLLKARSYKKSQILIYEEDQGTDLYILREGLVKVYRLHQDKEIIFNFQFPGDVVGEMEAIADHQHRVASIETMEPSHFWVISRPDFLRAMDEHPSILRRAYQRMLDHLRVMNHKVRYLSYLDVRLKAANLILDLYYNLGTLHESAYKIECKLTHHLLATMIGVTRESISKVMRDFHEEGILVMQQKYIYITDLERLQSMCDDMQDVTSSRKWRSECGSASKLRQI